MVVHNIAYECIIHVMRHKSNAFEHSCWLGRKTRRNWHQRSIVRNGINRQKTTKIASSVIRPSYVGIVSIYVRSIRVQGSVTWIDKITDSSSKFLCIGTKIMTNLVDDVLKGPTSRIVCKAGCQGKYGNSTIRMRLKIDEIFLTSSRYSIYQFGTHRCESIFAPAWFSLSAPLLLAWVSFPLANNTDNSANYVRYSIHAAIGWLD